MKQFFSSFALRIACIGIASTCMSLSGGHAHAMHHGMHESSPDAATGNGDVRSLDVYADGERLHLLYAKAGGESPEVRLFHRTSSDHGGHWSEPVRVETGEFAPHARGRGTDFQLAANGPDIVAIWITEGSGFGGRGPLASAFSPDGGQSWSVGASVSDQAGDGDHGFIDIVALPEEGFQAVWLDDRERTGKGLFTARSADGGRTWQENAVIDPATCECCPNTIRADAEGNLYTLYRDRDPRDMGLAQSDDGGRTWQTQPSPGAFDWQFSGCPHIGGGLAVEGSGESARLHTLVWTGKEGVMGIYYQHKLVSGTSWSPPRQMAGRNASQPDLAIDSGGQLAAVWTEWIERSARVRYTVSSDGGESWTEPQSLGDPSRYAEYPRIVAAGGTFHCFWTENDGTRTSWQHQKIAPEEIR